MSDTPILDDFLPALAKGVSVYGAETAGILKASKAPIAAFELAPADVEDVVRATFAGVNYEQPGGFDEISARECDTFNKLVVKGRMPVELFGRLTYFAFRSSNQPEPLVVSPFRTSSDGKVVTAICCFQARTSTSSKWVRHAWPHAILDNLYRITDEPSFSHLLLDESTVYQHHMLMAMVALAMINRFMTKLLEYDGAEPILRMSAQSSGSAHKLYNTARPAKAGIMPNPVRVLDLSRPKVEIISIGPSKATGKPLPPHVRGAAMRTYRADRYKKMKGQTRLVPAYGVHGAEVPDEIKTVVRGLQA